MANITASMVKDLRDKTGAGMMDCKNALNETNGDMEAAIDWLRKKGLSAAAKKSGRVAAEGLIGVTSAPGRAAMVEVNAETDFVARNDQFQAFVEAVANVALTVGEDLDAIKAAQFPNSAVTVGEQLTELIAKIGVLVAIDGSSEMSALEALGRQVGMHIAASRPEAVDITGVDPAALEREKAVLIAQARESKRPENIIEKMVEGRIRKFYEEVVLLEQVWVHDGESRVRAVVKKAGVTLNGFVRFALGEGIEKPKDDFAAEVAATAGV
ncbi:MAG TPA: translation elongation factor Ts [Rhodopila sp.]